MTRLAYTSAAKADAVSLAFQIGTRAASEQTGINLNSIRSWITRRQHGLPLHATPKVHERQQPHERPVSPELPEGVTTVDEQGHIRTPRSLFLSVGSSKDWFYEDRSDAVNVRKRGGTYTYRHVPVAMWALVQRTNVGLDEPPWREIVGIAPRASADQEVMVEECYHASALACLVDGRCVGHVENLTKTPKEIPA